MTVAVPLATAAHGGSVRVALPTGKTLDVAVPAGMEEGKSIRLRGQGHPGSRGAPAGDVIVTIRYAPHPLFKVEGRDLRLDLPITLYEAVLGGKVRVPTLGGKVEMSVAPGMSGGRVLRLRGKGLPADRRTGGGRPSRDDPDCLAGMRRISELTELMRRWRDAKPYDPRSGRAEANTRNLLPDEARVSEPTYFVTAERQAPASHARPGKAKGGRRNAVRRSVHPARL